MLRRESSPRLLSSISASVEQYFRAVAGDFDLLRSDSVVRESEQNPEFRHVVGERLSHSWDELRNLQAVVVVDE